MATRKQILSGGLLGAAALIVPQGALARDRGDGYTTLPYTPEEARPYFKPGPELLANKDQIDKLIWPAVKRTNESGWVWTTESCQGGRGHWDVPTLRYAVRQKDIGALLSIIYDVVWTDPANTYHSVRPRMTITRMRTPKGWSEFRIGITSMEGPGKGIRYFERIAERVN